MGHGVKLGLPTTSVHLFLEDKMKAVEKKSMGEEEEKNDLGSLRRAVMRGALKSPGLIRGTDLC